MDIADDDYTDVLGTDIRFPHCDTLILHSPGVCRFCDLHPDWQALRSAMGVAFSDDPPKKIAEHNLVPCPSTHRRPAEVRDRWGGNVPKALVSGASTDGLWVEVEPLPPLGFIAVLEDRLRTRGWTRVANMLAVWDERKLGR